jgi:outer membrane lipoprotein carrier protein
MASNSQEVHHIHPLRKLAFIAGLLLFALSQISDAADNSASDVHVLAQEVDNHYNHLRTLQTKFIEIYKGAGMERTESGTLWLKKPGKMRWEYRSPREKLFLGDGKDAWFYVPGDQQARKTSMRNLDDLQSPLAFMLGKTKLQKELQGLSLAPDINPLSPNNVMLRGVPKALADRINQVLLEITPERYISRLVIEQRDGSVTEYQFSDQKENVLVDDTIFRFTPPAGVEVVAGDLGQ